MDAGKDRGAFRHDETCSERERSAAGFVILNSTSLKEVNEFFVINGRKLVETLEDAVGPEEVVKIEENVEEKAPTQENGSSETLSRQDVPINVLLKDKPDVHPACLGSGAGILSLFISDDGEDQVVLDSKDDPRDMRKGEMAKKENRIVLKKEVPIDPFQMAQVTVENNARQKRASSIRAEERIKKQSLMEDIHSETSNKENEIESFFCGLPRRKRSNAESVLSKRNDSCRRERSRAEGKMEMCSDDGQRAGDTTKGRGKDLHSLSACETLKDKTNSPAKASPRSRGRRESSRSAEEGDLLNRFFLEDLGFLKNKKKVKKENRKLSNRYLRLKKRNTCFNQGYTTVSPKKKAVIDLFSCPKTFYKSVKRERTVHFDVENVVSVHNSISDVQPILLEQNDEPSFKWEKDKEKVDIVRRVDLGYETSVDDFIFRRVDKKIES